MLLSSFCVAFVVMREMIYYEVYINKLIGNLKDFKVTKCVYISHIY